MPAHPALLAAAVVVAHLLDAPPEPTDVMYLLDRDDLIERLRSACDAAQISRWDRRSGERHVANADAQIVYVIGRAIERRFESHNVRAQVLQAALVEVRDVAARGGPVDELAGQRALAHLLEIR